MSTTTTTKITNEQRNKKVEVIASFHDATVKRLSKGKPYLITAKAPYMYNSIRKVGFFESELELKPGGISQARDIYVELVHLNTYDPLDAEQRTLYRLRYNSEFRTEFENSPKFAALYFVAFDELEKVWQVDDDKKKPLLSTKDLSVPQRMITVMQEEPVGPIEQMLTTTIKGHNEIDPRLDLEDIKDINISQMTLRDFAAIMLRSPVSDKPWLNNIITHIQFK